MSATETKQTLVVHETKAEYEYDRATALRVWEALNGFIPAGGWCGYQAEGHRWGPRNDEDRIIGLFDLLNQSVFGDLIFGSLANDDQGSTLIERGDDE